MFRTPPAPPLLLLVDDDPTQAETTSYVAYELGCDFDVAVSGTEALEKAALRPPDVVLVDVGMPGLAGYDVCRRIKTAPGTAGTQILFVTARTEEEDLLHGFEALANDYVSKPFSARELKARVKNALRTKALVDALTARNRMLELQQEITDKLEEPADGSDETRARTLVPLLDRVASFFGAGGATLHLRRLDRPETRAFLSAVWPAGSPPSYLAALALSEDPRVERAPRMPGETRESGNDWTVASAPLWVDPELIGTLRLHHRGPPPAPGQSNELEHLVSVATQMARSLHRAELMEGRRAGVEA